MGMLSLFDAEKTVASFPISRFKLFQFIFLVREI